MKNVGFFCASLHGKTNLISFFFNLADLEKEIVRINELLQRSKLGIKEKESELSQLQRVKTAPSQGTEQVSILSACGVWCAERRKKTYFSAE